MPELTTILSEADTEQLYKAQHLLWLLCNLTERPINGYPDISVNAESLNVVLNMAHDLMAIPLK